MKKQQKETNEQTRKQASKQASKQKLNIQNSSQPFPIQIKNGNPFKGKV